MQRRELGLVRHHKGQTGLYQGAILAPGIRNWGGGGGGRLNRLQTDEPAVFYN